MIKYFKKSWWGRKIARFIFRKRYFVFFWKENIEWDWQSIIDMLDLKFTIMGTTIWKWGVATTSRDVAHRCWLLRKYLRDIGKADKRGSKEVSLLFKDIYGFIPEFDFDFEKTQLVISLIVPQGFDTSKREEMEKVYNELKVFERQEKHALEAIHDFCIEFENSIRYL